MSHNPSQTAPSGEPSLWAVTQVVYAGMTLFALPVTISSILIAELTAQFDHSTRLGGLLVAAQFLGMIVGGLAASRLSGTLAIGRLCVCLLGASVILEVLSGLLVEQPWGFLASRFGIGLGVGAIYTLVLSIVGISGQAEKVFGLATTACMITLALVTAVAGYVYATHGVRAGIFLIAAVSLLFAIPLARAPARRIPASRNTRATGLPNKRLGLYMSLGFLLGKMALGLGAAFVIMAANSKGVETRVASMLVGLALFTGMGGSMLSALIASRISRLLGVGIGLAGATAGWVLLYGQPATLPTLAALFIYPFFSAFYATFMLGTANALDPQGRWASLVSPLTSAGMALGAFTGGYVVGFFSLQALAVLLAGLLGGALLLFARVERGIPAPANSPP